MELIDIIPEFNLYEEFWKIYTKSDAIAPEYIGPCAKVTRSLISGASEIYGEVTNSVIGSGVIIEEGAVVRDSIIMKGSIIGKNSVIDRAVIAEEVKVGESVVMGVGEERANELKPGIYAFGLVTVGENSYIPANVKIGKNTAISGHTIPDDYPNGSLESGKSIMKAGDRA